MTTQVFCHDHTVHQKHYSPNSTHKTRSQKLDSLGLARCNKARMLLHPIGHHQLLHGAIDAQGVGKGSGAGIADGVPPQVELRERAIDAESVPEGRHAGVGNVVAVQVEDRERAVDLQGVPEGRCASVADGVPVEDELRERAVDLASRSARARW